MRFITRYDAERGYIYVGDSARRVTAFIRPHRYGLRLDVKGVDGYKGKFQKSYTIPGDLPKSKVIHFIIARTGVNVRTKDGETWATHASRDPENHELLRPSKALYSRYSEIRRALDESGLWQNRGKTNWPDCPKAFWKWVPTHLAVLGRKSSYITWWKHTLTHKVRLDVSHKDLAAGIKAKLDERERRLEGLEAEYVQAEAALRERFPIESVRDRYKVDYDLGGLQNVNSEFIQGAQALRQLQERIDASHVHENAIRKYYSWLVKYNAVGEAMSVGKFPEKPHSVRAWDRISADDLLSFVSQGVTRSKSWGVFAKQVYQTFYDAFLSKHREFFNETNQEAMIAYLAGLPKSPKVASVLNQMANEGMSAQTLLEFAPKHPQQFSALRDQYQKYRHLLDPRRERVNATYQPPRVALLEGWAWADHRSFGQLSDLYANCISTNGFYEREIVQGRAHVMYMPKRTNGGACAFVRYGQDYASGNEERWHVYEIRAFGNEDASERFVNEAERVATAINQRLPGMHPVVEQYREPSEILKHIEPQDLRVFKRLAEIDMNGTETWRKGEAAELFNSIVRAERALQAEVIHKRPQQQGVALSR